MQRKQLGLSVLMVAVLALAIYLMTTGKLTSNSASEYAPDLSPTVSIPDSMALANKPINDDASLYIGVQKVSAAQVQKLFPEAQGKPLFVEFRSKYCLDCKRMAPVLDKLLEEHPSVQGHIYDIKYDRKGNKQVFDAFQPSIVPILIFIHPDGTTSNVLYAFHPEEELRQELTRIIDRNKG